MAVHALMEVRVAPGRAREVLWAAARLGRRLVGRPGFRGLRVFRSEADADALMVLTEWDGWDAATAAESAAPITHLLQRVQGACDGWHGRRLEPLFHVQFPRRTGTAGMAQTVHLGPGMPEAAPARQKEFGLKAMSLPGTIGVLGGRCAKDTGSFFCAVEFESEEAMLEFADARTRHDWTSGGAATWWRKEPRLEVRADPLARYGDETRRSAESLGSLSVRIESSPDGASVVLRLHGQMDDAATERFVRVRDAVVARGCRHLTLDVSDLVSASTEALKTLLATARQVKESGGQFSLADNQGRFNRILRVLQLNRVLSPSRERARHPVPGRGARRKPVSLRFEPPGHA